MNTKRTTHFALLFLILFIMLSFFALAVDENQSSPPRPTKYEPRILEAFENQSYSDLLKNQANFIGLEKIDDELFARVRVVLKDNF